MFYKSPVSDVTHRGHSITTRWQRLLSFNHMLSYILYLFKIFLLEYSEYEVALLLFKINHI